MKIILSYHELELLGLAMEALLRVEDTAFRQALADKIATSHLDMSEESEIDLNDKELHTLGMGIETLIMESGTTPSRTALANKIAKAWGEAPKK